MRFDRFKIKMQEALQAAQEMAADKGNSEINNAYLLLATLDQPDGIVRPMFDRLGVAPDTVYANVSE